MAEQEITLMKGNEAIANAAIRCGVDGRERGGFY